MRSKKLMVGIATLVVLLAIGGSVALSSLGGSDGGRPPATATEGGPPTTEAEPLPPELAAILASLTTQIGQSTTDNGQLRVPTQEEIEALLRAHLSDLGVPSAAPPS
jgi:hypothetical protein